MGQMEEFILGEMNFDGLDYELTFSPIYLMSHSKLMHTLREMIRLMDALIWLEMFRNGQ